MAALDGLLCLSLEQAVAAPYFTSRLADKGCRVIKLERPEGDFARFYDKAAKGQSSYFVWLNRGKQSLVADIKNPADLALLKRIAAKADIFVQNLMPGAAARAGLGVADLRAANPRLVCVDISGYGSQGPYAQMKSYDMLLQAETGLADVTGRPEGPGRVGVSVCDIAAGMYAHQATLEALLERARTGQGAHIEVSLFDGMAEWMAVPLLHFDYLGKAPQRVGLAHPSIAPYSDFVTKDGVRIVISIQNEREWVDFCASVLGEPGFATHPDYANNVARVKHRPALDAKIASFFAARTKDEMTKLLAAARTAYGVANTVAEFSKHPQLRRVNVATPNGDVAIPAPPAIVNGERAPTLGAVPRVGEHSDAIRAEFA